MEPQPQAEAVGQRHFLLDRLVGVDRGGAFVLDHVARHQVAAVGCRVEQHVVGPALDPTVQHRFQRLVVGILFLERQIVAQDQAAASLAAQHVQQVGQRADVLAMDLDQDQPTGAVRVGDRVQRLDQGRFAHPARAPQHGVVRGQAPSEAQGVLQQDLLLPLHALQQRDVDARHAPHRRQVRGTRVPDERIRIVERYGRRGGRRQTLQRLGNTGHEVVQSLIHQGKVPGKLDVRGAESMVPTRSPQGPDLMNPFGLISPAYAQDAGGMLATATQFVPLVLIFAVFYFLLIRPQQQKQKEMRNMLSQLKRGDRVVTGGGILATVQRVPMVQDKDGKQVASSEIEVELGPNLRVTVLRETITSVIRPVAANDSKPSKD